MGELQSSLDALAADDLFTFSDGQLLDRTASLVRLVNRATAELTRTVRHGDTTQAAEHDGLRSMRSWLIGHALLSPTDAGRMVRSGRALEHLPAVSRGFADGLIGGSAVGEVAKAVTAEKLAAAAEQDVDLGEVDEALALAAATQTHEKLVGIIKRYAAALDPDGPEPDPTEGRSLTLSNQSDGCVVLRGQLDAIGGEKLRAALESIVQASRPKGDDRTRAEQQADALVQLCDNQLASGQLPTLRTVKPHLVLTLGVDDLVDPTDGPHTTTTGFAQTLSAARARWAACDAQVTRIVLGPEGQPLDLGRTHRVVPPHLRRAVEHRDRHCVFAGCAAPSHWCDVHHLVHWAHGGDTSLENSALLCERHHTKVHHGFRVERPPDGRWRTYRPDSTQILIGVLIQ